MLKKNDPVVYRNDDGMSRNGMEFGRVESVHGEWVAVVCLSPWTRQPLDREAQAITVVAMKDVIGQDVDDSVKPHQVRHAQLVAEALMRRIGDTDAVADDVRDAIRRELLCMHSFGFMEGQGVTVSEPWEWKREEHRIASAFVRYHDFCVEQDGQAENAPDSARLCEFLVWAKQAIRDGGAISAENWARVRCSTLEGVEGGEA